MLTHLKSHRYNYNVKSGSGVAQHHHFLLGHKFWELELKLLLQSLYVLQLSTVIRRMFTGKYLILKPLLCYMHLILMAIKLCVATSVSHISDLDKDFLLCELN